jgi:exopolysaccharide biosynthesis protein
MLSPLDIATGGYLNSVLSISVDGYLSTGDYCDILYDSIFFYNLGYTISDVVIVRPKDINVTRNGPFIFLSYFGNMQVHQQEFSLSNEYGKTTEEFICEFVLALNSKPIFKQVILENRRKLGRGRR